MTDAVKPSPEENKVPSRKNTRTPMDSAKKTFCTHAYTTYGCNLRRRSEKSSRTMKRKEKSEKEESEVVGVSWSHQKGIK